MIRKNASEKGLSFYTLIAGISILFLSYLLGYEIGQSDFTSFLFYFSPFFLAYCGIYLYVKKERDIYFFLGMGILARFILVFAFPNLSDDIYRFIWDGRLINHGINPFNYLPSFFLENGNNIKGIDQALFDLLNSPEYYTIYPPISQAIFTVATALSPDSYYGSALIMKMFMFLFECGSLYLIIQLLKHFGLPLKNVLIYALNPMVILEITGNLHFEGAMIFFLLLAIYLLIKKRTYLSAIAFALSIASKLLPLMFLPFLIKRLGWRKSLRYFSLLGLTLVLVFSPLFNATFFYNFANSLDLYFQKFEFNASIYYILRWMGMQLKGYNLIQTFGPILALIVLALICYKAFREKNLSFQNLFLAFLFAISIYLFFATTIHPWYTSMPLVFCMFTRFRFPMLWTGMIMLTYINYSYDEYFENLWIVALEYSLVFIFLAYELSQKSAIQSKTSASSS